MLNSLSIRNFRVFRDTSIEQLAPVNLLVGKNNSGKSCLLEALRVHASKAAPSVLVQLIRERDEYWEPELDQGNYESITPMENPLRYLFHGYHLPDPGKDEIQIGSSGRTDDLLRLSTKWFQVVTDDAGARTRIAAEAAEGARGDLVDLEMGLVVDYAGESSRFLLSVNDNWQNILRRAIGGHREEMQLVQVVPAQSATDESIPILWDKINLTDIEAEVIKCLQIIDPKVTGVAVIGESKRQPYRGPMLGRLPIVRLSDSSERIPLKSMGDGMMRLFHIVLALVNARKGFLLIDEFENGVHWSVQPQLWEMVFRLAQELDVQVFATTHSRDCVNAFAQVWKRHPDVGGFQRLEADPSHGAVSISYRISDLFDAIETEVEVR